MPIFVWVRVSEEIHHELSRANFPSEAFAPSPNLSRATVSLREVGPVRLAFLFSKLWAMSEKGGYHSHRQ